VDLVGRKEESFHNLLQLQFPSIKINVSKKADLLFPIVGAASIVAKVTRDRLISNCGLKEIVLPEKGIGSGYPSGISLISIKILDLI
jgi:ribonuclease H2 subunit A